MKKSLLFASYTHVGSTPTTFDTPWFFDTVTYPNALTHLQEGKYEFNLCAAVDTFQTDEGLDSYITQAQRITDAGIPIWIMIQDAFGHGGVVSTPASYTATPPDEEREIPSAGSIWGLQPPVNPDHPPYHTIPDPGQPHYYTEAMTPEAFHDYYALPANGGLDIWPANWWTTPESEYEWRFGEAFDRLESEVDFIGYSWEMGYDNGISWLRKRTNKTNKKLMQYADSESCYQSPLDNIYSFVVGDEIPGYTGRTDMEWRLSNVDAFMFEVYFNLQYPSALRWYDMFLKDANWSGSLGITTAWAWDVRGPTGGEYCRLWSDVVSPTDVVLPTGPAKGCDCNAMKDKISEVIPDINTYLSDTISTVELSDGNVRALPLTDVPSDALFSWFDYIAQDNKSYLSNIAYEVNDGA